MQIWMASPSKTAAAWISFADSHQTQTESRQDGGVLRRTTPLNPLTVLMDGGAQTPTRTTRRQDGGVERRLTRLNPHLPLLCGT